MTTTEKSGGELSLKKAFSSLTQLRTKITHAFKEIEGLKQRAVDLAKDVRSLKEMFSTNDNWGALAKQLIETGKEVKITDIGGHCWVCIVTWVDRYNIGIRIKEEDGMLLKGGLISIFPTKE